MKKQTVVIVDDNRHNLILEKDLLEIAGFEVFIAENGSDAIAMIRLTMPDIIIMDIKLPDMSGTEVISLLREDTGIAHIPVVFVTAAVMTTDVDRMSIIPNSYFMGKPINTRTFVLEVSQFLEQKSLPLPAAAHAEDSPCKTGH